MTKRLSKLAVELGNLEMRLADAGFEAQADEIGEALEKVEAVAEGFAALG